MTMTAIGYEYDGGTVGVLIGFDQSGAEVRIGVDWRPLEGIAGALNEGLEVEVEYEPWQVLRRSGV